MNYTSTYAIILLTAIPSIIGFKNEKFFDDLKYQEYKIYGSKEYFRLFSSALLHVDWSHLIFNMISFYCFAPYLVSYYDADSMHGSLIMIGIYLASVFMGNLLTLYYYQKTPSYSAVGASGGVCGVMFAAIILDPTISVSMMFLPVGIPGWIFAILYLAYSIYAMRKNTDSVGHTAHLGGALAGITIPILINPDLLTTNWKYIIGMLIPIAILAYFVIFKRDNYSN